MENRAQKLLENYMTAQNKKFIKLSEKAAKKFNPEVVHDLRSCTRRLRSGLSLMHESLTRAEYKKINRNLRKLGQSLGDIRQLDVAASDAKSYHLEDGSLKRRRKHAVENAKQSLARKERKKIHRQLKNIIFKIRKLDPEQLRPAGQDLLRELIETHRRHDLHKMRIAVKKARYALEALEIQTGPLKELQDLMGRAHDLKVLKKLAGQNPKVKIDRNNFEREAALLASTAINFAKRKLQ